MATNTAGSATPQEPAIPEPPDGLAAAGSEFWTRLHAEFDGFNPADYALIIEIARTMDLLDELRRTVAEFGVLSVGSKGQPVEHPALRAIATQQRALAALLRQLDLDDEDEPTPPAGSSVSPLRSAKARRAAQTRWRTA